MSLHRSQHEEFENQPDELEREEMIPRPRRKSRKKTIFFWILRMYFHTPFLTKRPALLLPS